MNNITSLHDDLKNQFIEALKDCNNEYDRYLSAMWFYTVNNPLLSSKNSFTPEEELKSAICRDGFKLIDEKLKSESNNYKISLMMDLSKKINEFNENQ